MVTFTPRFGLEQIRDLATRYTYPGEPELIRDVIPQIRDRRYLTFDELRQICAWKSSRIGRKVDRNTAEEVEELTRFAFSTESEKARIWILLLLGGVGWPTASVILHFCHRDRYPILDRRALWSLQVPVPKVYSLDIWLAYTHACRDLADAAGVSMRDLDRALWQYSKENEPPESS